MCKESKLTLMIILLALTQWACGNDSAGSNTPSDPGQGGDSTSQSSAIRGESVAGAEVEEAANSPVSPDPSATEDEMATNAGAVLGGSDSTSVGNAGGGTASENAAGSPVANENAGGQDGGTNSADEQAASTVGGQETPATDIGGAELSSGGAMAGVNVEGDPFEATTPCIGDDECPAGQNCRDGLCENELLNEASDTVRLFRMTQVNVIEPNTCATLLQVALTTIIATNRFNLLLEPGGYIGSEDEYLWYVGNGAHYSDGSFGYLNGYPVQNFVGRWRQRGDETPYWLYEENTPFLLNVPSRAPQTTTENGVTNVIRCYNQADIPITDLRIQPNYATGEGRNISPTLSIALEGFLPIEEAEPIEYPLNNMTQRLIVLLESCETADTDGDGVDESFPFHFEGEVVEVTANANLLLPLPDGSNRDPDAVWENPIECTMPQ